MYHRGKIPFAPYIVSTYKEEKDKRMEREVRIEDLQKLYSSNEMVKADCGGCVGCSACCRDMGNSIVLDPLDVFRLEMNLHLTFQELLADKLGLNVVDGFILPNLKMAGENEACAFLNFEGRCSIHAFRPGLCRLFPLGRYYEGDSFRYYLQSRECPRPNKTKIKVKKWIDSPDLKTYEKFVTRWHGFLKNVQRHLRETEDENLKKDMNLYVLNTFYTKPYDETADFYGQFYGRLEGAEKLVETIAW